MSVKYIAVKFLAVSLLEPPFGGFFAPEAFIFAPQANVFAPQANIFAPQANVFAP
jgi:hypothetical protein